MANKTKSARFKDREAEVTRFLPALVAGVGVAILGASSCIAAPITYTEEATATGSLGGVAFTNAGVLFSMTGDTTNVTSTNSSGEIIDRNSGTVTVSVAGGTPAAFTDGGAVFYNHGSGAFSPTIGFSNTDAFFYISLASPIQYDLRTSIGPLSGLAHIFPGAFEDTTGGTFVLTGVSSNATFTAMTSGTVMGDPHFTTYDGLHYDFQAAGDFTLSRSAVAGNSFDVQIRTRTPFDGSGVTVVSAVSAKLGDHRVTFDVDRASAGGSFVWIDGHAATVHTDSTGLALDAGRIVRISPEHYRVIWNTGEILDITINGSSLDVTTSLSSTDTPGSIEGLLGSDSGWSSDFQLADGTFLGPQTSTAYLDGVFADSWRVMDAISLFDNAAAVPEPDTLSLLSVAVGLTGFLLVHRATRRTGLAASIPPG